MLNEKEIEQLRKNAIVHKKVFKALRNLIKPWTTAIEIDKLCWRIAKENWVLCWFRWVYDFPANICISVWAVVVHWLPRAWLVFKAWDLATFDFGIKDKKYWVNTDAAISLIVWWDDKNPKWAKIIEANKKALYAGIDKARAWNTVWDIGAAIQSEIEWAWFCVVKDLTGHAIWKKLHEKPYIPNYWKPWAWVKLKVGMTLAIEPIVWETSWKITDKWDWEIYIADGSLGCQYEHTILITEGKAEIIV